MAFPLPPSAGGPTAPALLAWQIEYNGVVLGPSTDYGILKMRGMGDIPKIQSGDVQFPRDHGEFTGLDVYGGRDPEFDLWIAGRTSSPLDNDIALATATGVQPNTNLPLWIQLPGALELCTMCRPRKKPADWDAEFAAGARLEETIGFHANDPRFYAQGQEALVTIGSPATGLPFPVGPFPVGPFSTTSPSEIAVDNAGNCEMRPIIVFNGPLTNPGIQNNTIASAPAVNLTGTVASGDQLLLDLGTPHRALYYSGGISSGSTPANVMNWLNQTSSVWWNLLPGNNNIGLLASSGTGSAYIWWASAYML